MKLYTRIYRRGGFIWLSYEYRRDPVPRTGVRYSGFGTFYRTPKTTSESRASYLTEDEIYYGVKIRGRRNAHNLPNTYDDIPRSDWDNKNWKKHRKTQYKTS